MSGADLAAGVKGGDMEGVRGGEGREGDGRKGGGKGGEEAGVREEMAQESQEGKTIMCSM